MRRGKKYGKKKLWGGKSPSRVNEAAVERAGNKGKNESLEDKCVECKSVKLFYGIHENPSGEREKKKKKEFNLVYSIVWKFHNFLNFREILCLEVTNFLFLFFISSFSWLEKFRYDSNSPSHRGWSKLLTLLCDDSQRYAVKQDSLSPAHSVRRIVYLN